MNEQEVREFEENIVKGANIAFQRLVNQKKKQTKVEPVTQDIEIPEFTEEEEEIEETPAYYGKFRDTTIS